MARFVLVEARSPKPICSAYSTMDLNAGSRPRFGKIPEMPALRDTQPGCGGGGEAQLTDALREVIVHGGRVLAAPLPAGRRRHVIGSPRSYGAAFLEYVLRHRRLEGSRRARAQLLDG